MDFTQVIPRRLNGLTVHNCFGFMIQAWCRCS